MKAWVLIAGIRWDYQKVLRVYTSEAQALKVMARLERRLGENLLGQHRRNLGYDYIDIDEVKLK